MKLGEFTEEYVLALARQAYAEGEASFPIVAGRCALLVIDMQDEFVRPGWCPFWVPEATRQVPRIKALIECCREKGVPVIYTAFAKTHHYLDRPRTGDSMPNHYREPDLGDTRLFVEGKIWHELAPRADEIVILKSAYGAFTDTPIETVLKNLDRDTVIICGTLTNYCCGTTARQAYEKGFRVVFGSDVNATDAPEMQEPELATLRKGFARVLTQAQILAALAG